MFKLIGIRFLTNEAKPLRSRWNFLLSNVVNSITLTPFKKTLHKYFDSNSQLKYYLLSYINLIKLWKYIYEMSLIRVCCWCSGAACYHPGRRSSSDSHYLIPIRNFTYFSYCVVFIFSFPVNLGWREWWVGRSLRLYWPVPLTSD